MEFDWRPEKDKAIRAARGFGFSDAIGIFSGPLLAFEDTRQDYGEVRTVAIGRAGGVFYTVVYTDRDGLRRIITAWPSNRKEKARWLQLFG